MALFFFWLDLVCKEHFGGTLENEKLNKPVKKQQPVNGKEWYYIQNGNNIAAPLQ